MVEMSSDYQKRAAENGFASPDQVREALAHPETIVLDVRSDAEVEATGHLGTPQVVTTHCHYCREFDHIANEKIPKKDVVIYCASGRRAVVAKQRLQDMGYTNVMNAGGLADVLVIVGRA